MRIERRKGRVRIRHEGRNYIGRTLLMALLAYQIAKRKQA